MATPQALLDVLAALDADTTALGLVVDSLRAAVKENMTPAEVTAVQEKLTEVSGRLKAIAHDPDQPVPEEPQVEAFRSRR